MLVNDIMTVNSNDRIHSFSMTHLTDATLNIIIVKSIMLTGNSYLCSLVAHLNPFL